MLLLELVAIALQLPAAIEPAPHHHTQPLPLGLGKLATAVDEPVCDRISAYGLDVDGMVVVTLVSVPPVEVLILQAVDKIVSATLLP